MIRRPPRSTRTDTLLPYTTLFRSLPVPTPALGALAALRTLAFGGRETISAVARELRSSFTDFREKNPDLVVGGQAPRCLFNQKVSATRRFSAQSYSTPRMKAVGKAFDASLNDVVLRSEERRAGKECVMTGSSRWSPSH